MYDVKAGTQQYTPLKHSLSGAGGSREGGGYNECYLVSVFDQKNKEKYFHKKGCRSWSLVDKCIYCIFTIQYNRLYLVVLPPVLNSIFPCNTVIYPVSNSS